MQRIAAILSVLFVFFIAPLAVSAAEVGTRDATARARSHDSECRRHRAKKHSESKPKESKPKKKEGKKPYGFEL